LFYFIKARQKRYIRYCARRRQAQRLSAEAGQTQEGGSGMKKYICKSCEKAWYSAADLRICPDCHEELKEETDAYLLEM
jgi:uncharacterized paraquat-inducible protein A